MDRTVERSDLSAVDAYLMELGRHLRGPRRARADLLAEARGGLIDTTEGYERRGLSTADAQRRAVAEFGSMADVAPGYQAELAVAQSRRTALLILAIFIAQCFLWDDTGGVARGVEHGWMIDTVKWAGGVVMLGALLAFAGTARGVRLLGVRRELARATAVFGFVVAIAFAGMAVALTAVHSVDAQLLGLSGLPRAFVFLMIPLTLIAASANRCRRAASRSA
jgi:hypothetical protein